ncbi:heterokaryon incompatibility protein-domain-containing protein [Coniella lustricola]|uniref:Heterokaryon incompatibility protein-domain-containing protein n=1 Tax=Coniella lustricola TaxID=2025994 RepID=A0A2T3A4X5_9PEZI|nr:heterokaryon incompatibility protein-domain-containing protein [Coniella lustricola]
MKYDFIYSPLSGPRRTRVMKILPGSSSSMIRIDLSEMSVDNPPYYEALSYTWGGQLPDCTIECNKTRLKVTRNAEDAMRRLRSRHRSRYLWVDSVCIDQNSVEEKNVQVPCMKDIYRNAGAIVIWLGKEAPDIPLACRLARHLDSEDRWYTPAGLSRQLAMAKHVIRTDNTSLGRTDEIGWINETIDTLVRHNYWRRAWTVQEFMLNDSCYLYTDHGKVSKAQLRELFEDDPDDENTTRSFHLTRWSLPKTKDSEISVHELFELLPALQSTDAKDKVYALIFVFPRLLSGVSIDYNQDVTAVYTDAARAIITATRSLDIFSYACQSKKIAGCPSWVPDWAADFCVKTPTVMSDPYEINSFSKENTAEHRWKHMRASGTTSSSFEFDGISGTIRVKALVLGRIDGPVSDDISVYCLRLEWEAEELAFEYLSARRRFFQTCRSLVGRREIELQLREIGGFFLPNLRHCHQTGSEDKTRAIVKAWTRFVMSSKEETKKTLNELKLASQSGRPWEQEPLSTIEKELRRFLSVRSRFFITTRGDMGIGQACRPDDKVVLIAGCDKPFVVRKAHDIGSANSSRYRLVEEVYINGTQDADKLWRHRSRDVVDLALI